MAQAFSKSQFVGYDFHALLGTDDDGFAHGSFARFFNSANARPARRPSLVEVESSSLAWSVRPSSKAVNQRRKRQVIRRQLGNSLGDFFHFHVAQNSTPSRACGATDVPRTLTREYPAIVRFCVVFAGSPLGPAAGRHSRRPPWAKLKLATPAIANVECDAASSPKRSPPPATRRSRPIAGPCRRAASTPRSTAICRPHTATRRRRSVPSRPQRGGSVWW